MRHGLQSGLFIASLLVSSLALAACGGSSSGSASVASLDDVDGADETNAEGTPGLVEGEQALGEEVSPVAPDQDEASPQDPEEVFLAYAECLRDQGLEDVQDPDFSGGGGGPRGILSEIDRQDAEVQAAIQACRPLVAGIQRGFSAEDQAERQDRVLALAECLREEHGLDVADPDFSGGGFLRGGDLDLDDPEIQAAIQDCREAVGFSGGPGGGGRFGGGTR